MIISHRHKFIFFAVPKTATHAIRQALREHLGPDDWEQQVLYGQQLLPIPALAAIGHGHISARELQPHLDPQQWSSYFKFAFVRNPFDRFVSTCFFLGRNTPGFAESAPRFMQGALSRPRFRQRVLARPQAQQLTDNSGELAVDFLGHYETLQTSYDEICRRIGVESSQLPVKNASRHGSFEQYYDVGLTAQVADFYDDDLRLFGYPRGLDGGDTGS